MEVEIPQEVGLFFPRLKERLEEAPFSLLEKKTYNEELKRTARLAPKKNKTISLNLVSKFLLFLQYGL